MPYPDTGEERNARQDSNGFPTQIFIQGTAGTADVGGTSPIVRGAADPATGAQYVYDLNSGSVAVTVGTIPEVTVIKTAGTISAGDNNIGNVDIVSGTQQTLGTVGVVNSGTLGLVTRVGNVGTLESGTVTVSNPTGTTNIIQTGTLALATRVGNVGTIESGTVTVSNPGTTVNIATGSQQTLGTVGVVSALTMGSVVIHGQNGGANKALSVGTGSYGTILTVSTPHDASAFSDAYANNPQSVVDEAYNQVIQGVFPMVFNGATWDRVRGNVADGQLVNLGTNNDVSVTSGSQQTLGTVGVLNNGTLALVTRAGNIGTIESGTIRVNPRPITPVTSFGTLGTAGGSFFATISAASGAGTSHVVSGVSIVVQAGTPDVRVLLGSAITGAGVLAAGAFPPGGGIVRDFTPIESGTNSEIIYHFVGAGTAFITVQYWKAV